MNRKLTFEAWFAAVDKCCAERAGVSVHDLPDKLWRDWYGFGMKPCEAANRALHEEGFYPYAS